MSEQNLHCIEISPGEDPALSVIWMHGLGADNRDFLPIVPELELSAPCRFVFPNAPMRPVALNGGMPMRAWYDISAEGGSKWDDIQASCTQVARLLDSERERGFADNQIILAGFSQGGVIAQHLALHQPQPLGGILGMSTYLPELETARSQFTEASKSTPWMLMHGRQDPMIPFARAHQVFLSVKALGYEPQWKEYDMQHSLCPQQIVDIRDWLEARLPA